MLQEPRRGHCAKDVTLSACEHPRQHVSSYEYVRHEVHVPDALPFRGHGFRSAPDADARIRAEDVDPPVGCPDVLDQLRHVAFERYVAAQPGASDLAPHRLTPSTS